MEHLAPLASDDLIVVTVASAERDPFAFALRAHVARSNGRLDGIEQSLSRRTRRKLAKWARRAAREAST